MADRLNPTHCRVKVGKELFTAAGPQVVEALQNKGFEVFLDLKFHDIPNTTAGRALGGRAGRMDGQRSRQRWSAHDGSLSGGADKRTGQRPLLTAVTVLTSLEQEDLQEVGIDIEPMVQVQRLARLTQECGLDGVVCSAREAKALRNTLGDDLQLVTPGIRPADASADDQKRILTPAQAMENGSTYLVIGRPITSAADPAQALDAILQSL